MPRASDPGRAGFSLVEALVVLAITSVLLVLVFSVTAGARNAGFSLARRSVAVADAEVGTDSLRVLLRGVRLPQRGRWPGDFVGEPDALAAYVAPSRATACPDAAGRPLRLLIQTQDGRSRLVCQTADGRSASVLDLGPGAAGFSYALAGRPWTDRLVARLPPERSAGDAAAPPPTLWIRLASSGGREVVEAIDPPPPVPAGRDG